MTKPDNFGFMKLLRKAPLVEITKPGDDAYPCWGLLVDNVDGRPLVMLYSHGSIHLHHLRLSEHCSEFPGNKKGLGSLIVQGLTEPHDAGYVDIQLLDSGEQNLVVASLVGINHWMAARHIRFVTPPTALLIAQDLDYPLIVRAACYPKLPVKHPLRREIERLVRMERWGDEREWKMGQDSTALAATMVALTCVRDKQPMPESEAVNYIVGWALGRHLVTVDLFDRSWLPYERQLAELARG